MQRHFATRCVHAGSHTDVPTEGTSAPIYTSTAYGYLHSGEERLYPRYFNTSNQRRVAEKVAQLEGAPAGILFGSGMAAISTALLSFLAPGDHVLMQKSLYGGTIAFADHDLTALGIEVSYTRGFALSDFEAALQPNTRVLYLESPSNPLCQLVDIEAIGNWARQEGLLSMIDNTFASPVNQNPFLLGIDIVLHSATKYLGGHSDISAGLALGTEAHMEQVLAKARHFGGSCDPHTAALLERSIKTLLLRVRQQSSNASELAEWLAGRPEVSAVHYPGLPQHPHHELARRQMHGFGAMLSFELQEDIDPIAFQQNLGLVASAMSLGGVDTSICSPALTSHRGLSPARRIEEGISDQLLRVSLGIEDIRDLKEDFQQAFQAASSRHVHALARS